MKAGGRKRKLNFKNCTACGKRGINTRVSTEYYII